jgi:hypothetical protein
MSRNFQESRDVCAYIHTTNLSLTSQFSRYFGFKINCDSHCLLRYRAVLPSLRLQYIGILRSGVLFTISTLTSRTSVAGQATIHSPRRALPQSLPIVEKLDRVCHFLRRLGRDQFEQPPHLLADRVMLLFGDYNPCMGPALKEKFGVQPAVVPDIEGVERPLLSGCPKQMFFVLTFAHSCRPSANDINASQIQGANEISVLRVFIKIQSDFQG